MEIDGGRFGQRIQWTAEHVVDIAHAGDAQARSALPSSVVVGSLSDVAKEVGSRPRQIVDSTVRLRIVERARKFHQDAGTWTGSVQRALESIAAGAEFGVVAHQPIAFAYEGVVFQHFLLNAVRRRLPARPFVVVHVIMDTDDCREKYLRSSKVPMPSAANGYVTSPIRFDRSMRPMFSSPTVDHSQIDDLMGRITRRMDAEMNFAKSISLAPASQPEASALDVFRHAAVEGASVADFNAFCLSRAINLHWKLDSVFVRYSEVLPLFSNVVERVLADHGGLIQRNWNTDSKRQKRGWQTGGAGLLWVVCRSCQQRSDRAEGPASCPHCGAAIDPTSVGEGVADLSVIPKVAVDDLVRDIGFGALLSADYASSSGHVISSCRLLDGSGVKPPLHVLSRPRAVRLSFFEVVAGTVLQERPEYTSRAMACLRLMHTGRSSLLSLMSDDPGAELCSRWMNALDEGDNLAAVSNLCDEATPYAELRKRLLALCRGWGRVV